MASSREFRKDSEVNMIDSSNDKSGSRKSLSLCKSIFIMFVYDGRNITGKVWINVSGLEEKSSNL